MLYGGADGQILPLPLEPPVVRLPVLTRPDPPAPVVTLKVRVPACSPGDENLEYRIFVENCSPLPAHQVIVRNVLPANARFVRASPQPHRSDPELQWHLGTLPGNACREITLILAPTGLEDVTNCLRVQYEHGQCVTTRRAASGGMPRITPIPELEPPPPLKMPVIKDPPEVKLAKLQLTVAAPPRQNINQPATYSITVVNSGQTIAANVLLDSLLPAKLELVKASDQGTFLAGSVAWLLGDLEPGGKRTVDLIVRAKGAGDHCIRARVLADKGVFSETESCTTFFGVSAPSALLLEMYDRDDPVTLGGNTSYPIFVQNQGQTPITNLRIIAQLPEGMDQAQPPRGPVAHKNEGKLIVFAPLASLAPGARVEYEVFARALAVGDLRFRIRLTADQLKDGGPVDELESTTVFDEDAPVRFQMQSRQNRRPRLIPLDQ